MEELLNKLIEKGWKPFGKEKKELKFVEIGKEMLLGWEENYYCSKGYSYRELVSMESQLRQFVCKHHFVQGVNRWTLNAKQRSIYDKFITSEKEYRPYTDYQYWLIESSLVEEKDLAKFLLDNIKIDGK